jgi:hypothetical protein
MWTVRAAMKVQLTAQSTKHTSQHLPTDILQQEERKLKENTEHTLCLCLAFALLSPREQQVQDRQHV